jgi:type IV pilus assembly protein PilN
MLESPRILINLLPHREIKRERRKKDFVGLIVLTAIVAAGIGLVVALGINQQIASQAERNDYIKQANAKLDEQIKEIAALRQEIDGLKARQQAVENLQSDRTTPVHLLDELVKFTPEGVFMKQVRQDDRKLTLIGFAQSNERIADLLYRLSNQTVWMEKPELIESKLVTLGGPNSKDGKQVYEFALTTLVKRPSAPDPTKKASVAANAVAEPAQVAAKTQ